MGVLKMTKYNEGMSHYDPKPKVGFGCHSCTHNKTECTKSCEPNSSGGTGYEWNKIANHKVFWIRKTKINAPGDKE